MSQIFGKHARGARLFISGSKVSDEDVRDQNGTSNFRAVNAVLATHSIANVVKSSLGPVGMDKMLVDDIGVVLFENGLDVGCYCD